MSVTIIIITVITVRAYVNAFHCMSHAASYEYP